MENEKISVTLTVAQWNIVMQALGERPFAQVAALIQEVKTQADAQLAEKAAGSDGSGGA
jgi:hypothetical protein